MSHNRKVDANHARLVDLARRYGAHVVSMAPHPAAGFDALIVRGESFICEFKDGSLPQSHRHLTDGEIQRKKAIEDAGGKYWVLETDDDLLRMFNLK